VSARHPLTHHAAGLGAGLALLVIAGCAQSASDLAPDPVTRGTSPDGIRPLPGTLHLHGADPQEAAPVDPTPAEPGVYEVPSATLDPGVRDENVGVLTRADVDFLVLNHPLVQRHLAAHPAQGATLHERLNEALAAAPTPRVFFIAAGRRLAYPLSQIVSFRAEALVKLADGSLVTQALVASAPAVSFGVDPEPGLFLGLVSAPAGGTVSLSGIDASVFWANGPRNSTWSAYWEGHQEVLTSTGGLDLVLGNLGLEKLAPLDLVVSGAIAEIDTASLPRLMRAPGASDVAAGWWDAEPVAIPVTVERGALRARLADGVLALEEDGVTLWTRPVDETEIVAVDAEAGRVIVAGAHATSVFRVAGTLELRLPFGPGDDPTGGGVVLQDGYDPTSACDNLQNLANLCAGYALRYGMTGWAALAVYYAGWADYYRALATSLGCGQ
jgi:hypothetical protein